MTPDEIVNLAKIIDAQARRIEKDCKALRRQAAILIRQAKNMDVPTKEEYRGSTEEGAGSEVRELV